MHDPETGQLLYTSYSAVGTRLGLAWEYQFIPLGIMATCAAKLMELEPLAPGTRFEKYTLPAGHELVPVQAAVVARVKQHGETGRHALQLPGDPDLAFAQGRAPAQELAVPLELAHKVRNRYLHRSASTGLQGLNDNRKGMGERREDGRPHRLVFPG